MSKQSTYPYLFDEAKSISVTNLRDWGYLKPQTLKSGKMTWSRNGIETGSIGFTVKLDDHQTVVFFDYVCDSKHYKYEVPLVFLPSNLGFGRVWYFHCPFTNKRCRILHLIGERFMHRSALPSGMYECQTRSKTWRGWEKSFGSFFEMEKYYEEIYSKHFKKYYNGKPTKRYFKLMQKIKTDSFNL